MEKIYKNYRLSPDTHEKIRDIADKKGMNMEGVMLFLLTLYYKEEAKNEDKN